MLTPDFIVRKRTTVCMIFQNIRENNLFVLSCPQKFLEALDREN